MAWHASPERVNLGPVPSRPLNAWIAPLALAGAGALATLLLPGPAGSDPDLWVYAALNLGVGEVPQLPPAFPTLLLAVHRLGPTPFAAAALVAHAAAPLIPPLTWLLARQLGASPPAALVAGLLTLLTASVATFDAQYSLQSLVRTRTTGPDGNFNFGRVSDANVDQLVDAMKTETDVTKRNALIREALVRTRDEFLYVPLHHQLRPWAMKTGVTTLHRADDRPAARFTSMK